MTENKGSNERAALLNRAALIERLAALWCEPEEDLHNNPSFMDELVDVATKVSRKLTVYAKELKDSTYPEHRDLMVEYAKLFVGPFAVPAMPYASIYLGSKTLNNEITQWVSDLYAKCGLNFDSESNDLPDHLAVELDFLRYLTLKQYECLLAEQIEDYKHFLKLHQVFIHQHLFEWLSEFHQKVEQHATLPFYKALSKLTLKTSNEL